MAALAQMIGVCIVRNGENCKRCLYYGKACEDFRRKHRGKKPMDVDENKAKVHKEWFSDDKRKK